VKSTNVAKTAQLEQRLAIEHAVTRALGESSSLGEASERIIRAVCETLGWACGAHWALDPESGTMRCAETWGTASPAIGAFLETAKGIQQTREPGGLIRRTWLEDEPVWIADVAREKSFRRAADAQKAGLHSAFAFPLKAGAQVTGVMEFFSPKISRPDAELLDCAAYIGGLIGQFLRRRQAEDELGQFRTAMDASPDQIYLIDPVAMRYLYVNETACRVNGYTREEYLKVPPRDASRVTREALQRMYEDLIAKGGESVATEAIFAAEDGRRGWFEVHRRALRLGDRWIIVIISRDTTQRKLAEQAAVRLGRMYAALGATNEAIMRAKSPGELYQRVCDAAVDGGKFVNTSVLLPDAHGGQVKIAAVSGMGKRQLRGASISLDEATPEGRGLVGMAFHTQQPSVSNDFLKDERTRPWHDTAQKAGVKAGAAVSLVRGGRTVGVLLFYSAEKRAFDEEIVKLLVGMAENIAFALDNFEREDERKRADERIRYLATHDGLTGLPNRTMFSQLLNLEIESARRYERKFAVLFIDLDRFKTINDTLGHQAGDALLIEMSVRLKASLRTSDVVARLGGDEFVVMVQEVSEIGQAAAIARKILSATIKPMVIAGQECRVTASVGIAMYPADAQDEQSLMKNADMAMYLAKEEGKNNYQFFSKDIRSQSLEKMALEKNLRGAMERNEFTLHYQAKLDLKSESITGVEALLRWNNAELGSVSPVVFIPVAEETGLIVPIGIWVLQTACRQNMVWQRAGLRPMCMAVNLSPRQFSDPDLVTDIAAVLSETGMTPQLLEIEITESMVMHNTDRAVKVLGALKALGVRLALDDFGTGYSSLAQLKRFPIDTLKVDRSFIREIPNDTEDKAITKAIIALGRSLSLNIVAEGVETLEQQTFLREHACDEMQGFYFSKPIIAEKFAELLRTHDLARKTGAA
jgi:diguanylate cyclase (GGDEF)-like protein/PAS domain S-box-containing protein